MTCFNDNILKEMQAVVNVLLFYDFGFKVGVTMYSFPPYPSYNKFKIKFIRYKYFTPEHKTIQYTSYGRFTKI